MRNTFKCSCDHTIEFMDNDYEIEGENVFIISCVCKKRYAIETIVCKSVSTKIYSMEEINVYKKER